MNIFFTSKHDYIINDSIEGVRDRLKSVIGNWYDFSRNITGRVNDNRFKLTHKWSFTSIRWIEYSPAYLTGTFMQQGDKTTIKTTLRPNPIFVIIIYFLMILFLCELIGINTFIEGPKSFKLMFFPFFSLIIFGIGQIFTIGLRKRFEQLMDIE